MNIHCPQSWDARAELPALMAVEHHILTDAASRPAVMMVQDCLLAMYHLTDRRTLLSENEVEYVLGYKCEETPAIRWKEPGTNEWTMMYPGKQVFSQLIPPVNLQKRVRGLVDADPFDMLEREVIIRNGRILRGRICKESMNSSGGVIHVTCLDLGNHVARRFMSVAGRALHRWFEGFGFSIGIDDICTTEETYDKVGKIIRIALDNVRDAQANKPQKDALEAHTVRVLQDILPRSGQSVLQTMCQQNALRCMAKGCGAGSKGSKMNVAQMGALVGQQMVNGRRVRAGRAGRTLPSYPPNDTTPEAHGLCVHPYTIGLTPEEFFFHAMGGREGLVDTAVKTASTGYIHRRLATYMKHHMLKYDGSVRNYQNEIISFNYGDDGFKADKLERVTIPEICHSDTHVASRYGATLGPMIISTRARIRETRLRSENIKPTTIYIPINVKRIIDNIVTGTATLKFDTNTVLSLIAWVKKHAWVASDNVLLAVATGLGRATTNTTEQQHLIVKTIKLRLLNAICPPGYMAGTIAAQSIGEPTTQMTLNSFHLAGVASEMEMTSGVKRLKECIDISKHNSTPVTIVPLKSQATASFICDALPAIYGARVVSSVDIHHQPELIPDAVVLSDTLRGLTDFPMDFIGMIEVNRTICDTMGIDVTDVMAQLRLYYSGNEIDVCSTEACDRQWIVYVRFRNIRSLLGIQNVEISDIELSRVCINGIKRLLNESLAAVRIRGIPGISSCYLNRTETYKEGTDGEYVQVTRSAIFTAGCNLQRIMATRGVDANNVYSNSFHEVSQVLGIEAAQRVLFKEIEKVLSYDGNYISSRHIWLLVQSICRYGYLAPVSRHGMR